MSGGVDSTASLIENHAWYGPRHPRRIAAGLVVYGLDPSTDADVERPDAFLRALCEDFGIDLVAVRTNLRDLDPSTLFWWDRAQTPMWSGMAHAFAADLREMVIGADDPLGHEIGRPYRGTHPVLAHCFVTSDLRIHHNIGARTRLERLRLVAASDRALQHLQVCNRARVEWRPLNCGRCEKCVRTQLGLAAIGATDRCTSFPPMPDADCVAATRLENWDLHTYYEPLVPLLEDQGRSDLAHATRQLLRRNRARRPGQHAKRTLRRVAGLPSASGET